jgi:hypothetical protein
MLKVKLLLPVFVALLGGCVTITVPSYAPRITLETTHKNVQDIKVNNLLLVGTGPVASRVFLDNLTIQITRSLQKRNIRWGFSYAGNIPRSAPVTLDTLASASFDTYLVFRAAGKSYLDMTKPISMRTSSSGSTTYIGNQYKETYTVSLYNKKEKMQLVWQGEMEVNFDLANDGRYEQIAHLILKELEKEHILQE